MPGEKGVAAGRSLGLHDVPGGEARGGPTYAVELRDVEASFGRHCEFGVKSRIRARAGWQRRSLRDVSQTPVLADAARVKADNVAAAAREAGGSV